MKAQELRIGNWAMKSLISGQGRTIESQLGVQDLVRIAEGTRSFVYKPILLTPEWLERMGFEEIDGKYIKDGFFCYLIYGGGTGWKTWVNLSKDNFTLALVWQVHQLQNLYFALTGEELTIKEDKE